MVGGGDHHGGHHGDHHGARKYKSISHLGFPDVWVFLIMDHHRPLKVDSKLAGRDLGKVSKLIPIIYMSQLMCKVS